jgi:hypothetical protein
MEQERRHEQQPKRYDTCGNGFHGSPLHDGCVFKRPQRRIVFSTFARKCTRTASTSMKVQSRALMGALWKYGWPLAGGELQLHDDHGGYLGEDPLIGKYADTKTGSADGLSSFR